MKQTLQRLLGTTQINSRYVLLGAVLALGSVAFAAYSITQGDVVTALSLLLYLVVGVLLAAIGLSPPPSAKPE